MSRRDLKTLFDPRSVAIVGASNDPAKWGHWLARGALKGEHRRSVFLVNRNGGEILERTTFRSLADLPEAPELVVLSVPEEGFEAAVEDALAAGARALVGISAGLGETGEAGRSREEAVVARVQSAGAVLLGPNCMGVFDAEAELEVSSNAVPAGPIGLLTQSGNIGLELGLLAEDYGLGFSRFVSLGNQADLDAADLMPAFAAHDPTRLVAVYCEDFRDGRAFAEAARTTVETGKPVLLLTVGGSEAGARAARSHTGALVSDSVAVDAACRAAGILRVSSPKELIDLAQGLLAGRAAVGGRAAVVADGGGHSALAADLAAARGLELPLLSDELAKRIAAVLPPTAAVRNPVDFAGGGEEDFWSFARVPSLLLESGEVDSVLLTGYFGGYSEYANDFEAREVDVARELARAAGEGGRPLLVHTMYAGSKAAQTLREGGVPVYREVEAAVNVLARLRETDEGSPRRVPRVPDPVRSPPLEEGYWAARELLSGVGIAFAEARPARDGREALSAAAELGYPVALKALGPLHKSAAGGVALGLADAGSLEQALSAMTTLAAEEYSVEAMAPLGEGLELIVGTRWDRRFGPITLVGAGGRHAELLHDVAVALAPVNGAEAEELIRSLRIAALFPGADGRETLDVGAAAEAGAALSQLAASRPDLAEIEINPLLVTPRGALALDARLVFEQKGDANAG